MSAGRGLWALALILAGCAPSEPPAPQVSDAWIRAAPPSAGMTAGYLTISNPADRALILARVRSAAFERVEMHTTIMDGGVAKMRMEPRVTIPAGASVSFEPGGRHLMLFGAQRPIADGDAVRLILTFEADDARQGTPLELAVEAPVRRAGAGHEHHH